MKNFIYLSLFGLFLTIGCKKEEPTPTPTPLTLPFENDNIKLALVTAAAPSGIRGIFFMNASTVFAELC